MLLFYRVRQSYTQGSRKLNLITQYVALTYSYNQHGGKTKMEGRGKKKN